MFQSTQSKWLRDGLGWDSSSDLDMRKYFKTWISFWSCLPIQLVVCLVLENVDFEDLMTSSSLHNQLNPVAFSAKADFLSIKQSPDHHQIILVLSTVSVEIAPDLMGPQGPVFHKDN